jgi:hypothetical protein
MGKFKDLTGMTFGFLKVLGKSTKVGAWQEIYWECLCTRCGKRRPVIGRSLSQGTARSCGCLHHAEFSQRMTKHGDAAGGRTTSEYLSWQAMIQRCRNPQNISYHNYGGRGIQVCERWEDYSNFLNDMGRKPGKGYSLERKDSNGNYCPENCVWATIQEQENNKRDTLRATIGGVMHSIADWYSRVRKRVLSGWEPLEALTTPPTPRNRRPAISRKYKAVPRRAV